MSEWHDRMITEFRENRGTTARFGRGLVLLHTIGARSGEQRVVPAAGFRVEGGWLVIASAAGSPKNPGWYFNLLAHPELTIEAPDDPGGIETVAVRALEVDGADYPAAWTHITTVSPHFLEYAKTTRGRRMPIFRLTPR